MDSNTNSTFLLTSSYWRWRSVFAFPICRNSSCFLRCLISVLLYKVVGLPCRVATVFDSVATSAAMDSITNSIFLLTSSYWRWRSIFAFPICRNSSCFLRCLISVLLYKVVGLPCRVATVFDSVATSAAMDSITNSIFLLTSSYWRWRSIFAFPICRNSSCFLRCLISVLLYKVVGLPCRVATVFDSVATSAAMDSINNSIFLLTSSYWHWRSIFAFPICRNSSCILRCLISVLLYKVVGLPCRVAMVFCECGYLGCSQREK